MSTVTEIAAAMREMAAELEAMESKAWSLLLDTMSAEIDSQAKKIHELRQQNGVLNSLCLNRGRENEQLRSKLDASAAKIDEMAKSPDYWRNNWRNSEI